MTSGAEQAHVTDVAAYLHGDDARTVLTSLRVRPLLDHCCVVQLLPTR